jgi:hypothetical protein
VKPNAHDAPLRVADLLVLLGPDKLDVIEQQVRIMREAYHAPFTVHDYDEFKNVLFDFYAHYQITFFNADVKRAAGTDPYWRHFAYP